jgi:hypothetical protein
VSPADRIDAEFFDRVASSVKVVATRSVGYDHIDIRSAARRHIAVANTPGVLTDAVADATILLLLGASRHVYEAQRFIRAGEWAHTAPVALIGRQLTGKALGILGMGRIGQAVALRARALGMQIHYADPRPRHWRLVVATTLRVRESARASRAARGPASVGVHDLERLVHDRHRQHHDDRAGGKAGEEGVRCPTVLGELFRCDRRRWGEQCWRIASARLT